MRSAASTRAGSCGLFHACVWLAVRGGGSCASVGDFCSGRVVDRGGVTLGIAAAWLLVALPFRAELAQLLGVSQLLLEEILGLEVFVSASLKLFFVFIKKNRMRIA